LTKPVTKNDTAPARALLESAYKELMAASKVAVGDDGATLMAAAAALDVAVESLMPGAPDLDLARASCQEALALAHRTRAYAQGGNIANVLDPARHKLAEALKLFPA
jgi:hypothetical protein